MATHTDGDSVDQSSNPLAAPSYIDLAGCRVAVRSDIHHRVRIT
jgi:hypothetical protein